MLLSYNELIQLQRDGVIENSQPEHVNGASIDVTLGRFVWSENKPVSSKKIIDLASKESPEMVLHDIKDLGINLEPGGFLLGQTEQVFNLPLHISAEFKLKSSAARSGLNHALAGWCLTGDTEIATLDGKGVKIKDLEGTDGVWVYAINKEGRMVVARASASRVTKKVTETVRVTLDNGESFECTPDHKILMRDKTYTEAGKLVAGDALMPLNRRHNHEGREEVYCPNPKAHKNSGVHSGKWYATHRLVGETVLGGIPAKHVVHHKDFDIWDNRPENLEVMSSTKHIGLHSTVRNKQEESRQRSSERASKRNKKLWADPKWAENKNAKSSEMMKKLNAKQWSDPSHRAAMLPIQRATAIKNFSSVSRDHLERSCKIGSVKKTIKKIFSAGDVVNEQTYTAYKRQNAPTVATLARTFGSFSKALTEAGYENHKVVSVETLKHDTPIPVYDITVPEHHNFGLACGAFVHNCDPSWYGSVLTLELTNTLKHHTLHLKPGMKIGQIIFYRATPVPHDQSYAVRGQYNKDTQAQPSRGIR